MKIKELTAGKQYAIKGNYGRPFKGILLSTTDRFVRNGRSDSRPANSLLGERGGLPFAVERWEGRWYPQVVQPGAVFAQADDFDKALEDKRAKDEAEWQVRKAELEQRQCEEDARRKARRERNDRLNEALVARGLPKVVRYDHWQGNNNNAPRDEAVVDVALLEQVVRRLKPLTTKTLGRGKCGPSVTYKS